MCIKVQLQPYHAAEFKIEPVDPTDFLGFSFIHDQATILKVIPQWDADTHPHALSFRSSNLVADALASHLSLELRKESRTFRVSRPIDDVVLNCWVTETKLTPRASKASTILAKSAKLR